jgi:hypothetical protein
LILYFLPFLSILKRINKQNGIGQSLSSIVGGLAMTCEKPERANFVIIHDYQETPGVCMPGEEIAAIILVYRGKRYRVPLASTHL